jgi:hypothetical protein
LTLVFRVVSLVVPLKEIVMLTDQYLSMKELAVLFGSTQKRIGLALERLGLWRVPNKATLKARQQGYVGLRQYPDLEDHPLTVWNREKTIAALESAGLKLLPTFTGHSPAGETVEEYIDTDDDRDDYADSDSDGEDSADDDYRTV